MLLNEQNAFPEFHSGPLRVMRKSDTCSFQGESHTQTSCKEPHPQSGEKQTQAQFIHKFSSYIHPDNKYLPNASSVSGSLGKLQCLKLTWPLPS